MNIRILASNSYNKTVHKRAFKTSLRNCAQMYGRVTMFNEIILKNGYSISREFTFHSNIRTIFVMIIIISAWDFGSHFD